jgi:hypothetical protein
MTLQTGAVRQSSFRFSRRLLLIAAGAAVALVLVAGAVFFFTRSSSASGTKGNQQAVSQGKPGQNGDAIKNPTQGACNQAGGQGRTVTVGNRTVTVCPPSISTH